MAWIDELHLFCPDGKREWLEAMAECAEKLVPHYEMTTIEWQHFAGQWGHETNGLSLGAMRENMNFTSAKRIMDVYGYRLGVALERDAGLRETYGRSREKLAAALVRNPTYLADVVYGGREGTPWMKGSRYIGRGPTQITHLNNYRAIRDEIRNQPGGEDCPDLVEHPEELEKPEWGVRCAFADWHIKGLKQWAIRADVDSVSAALNTGDPAKKSITNGLQSRRRWTARAVARWPDIHERRRKPSLPTAAKGDEGDHVAEIQKKLHEKGYPCGNIDGQFGTLSERAVVALQHEHGLLPTGCVDEDTHEILDITGKADLGEREKLTPEELAKRGSSTIPAAKSAGVIGRFLAWLGLGSAGVEATSPGTIVKMVETGAEVAKPAKSLLGAFGDILTTQTLVVAGLLAVGLVGWRLVRLAEKVIEARIKAAQAGANLER